MKKNKKVLFMLLISILALTLLVFIGIYVFIYWHDKYVYANPNNIVREDYWQVMLPKKNEMEQIIIEHTPYGPQGEAIHHSIYGIARSEIQITFRADKSRDIENMCVEYCEKIETQSSYVPDFSQKYIWILHKKYDDTLILLYFPDIEELHVFEEFF